VLEDESLVAKVYHKPTKAYEYKLKAMLVNPPENPTAGKGHISIAWPIDLLRTGEKGDRVVGFLMPRVQEMHSMLDFYNPKNSSPKVSVLQLSLPPPHCT
jgi:DNA-binding helix-hairpin-helix protein with protein kinase domain